MGFWGGSWTGETPGNPHVIQEQLLRRVVKRFRGGLVFQAHRCLYHSTLGSGVIKKNLKRRHLLPRPWKETSKDVRPGCRVGRVCISGRVNPKPHTLHRERREWFKELVDTTRWNSRVSLHLNSRVLCDQMRTTLPRRHS